MNVRIVSYSAHSSFCTVKVGHPSEETISKVVVVVVVEETGKSTRLSSRRQLVFPTKM